jgi:hypothetical protein
MKKDVCLDGKTTESYEEVIRQIIYTDSYIGNLFSDYIHLNLKKKSFYGLKKDTLIVDLVIFT